VATVGTPFLVGCCKAGTFPVTLIVKPALVTCINSESTSLHFFAPGHVFSSADKQFIHVSTSPIAVLAAAISVVCMTQSKIMIAELKRYWTKNARWCEGGMESFIDWAKKIHDRDAQMDFVTEEDVDVAGWFLRLGREFRCKVIRTA
jgi:hypothetical protein